MSSINTNVTINLSRAEEECKKTISAILKIRKEEDEKRISWLIEKRKKSKNIFKKSLTREEAIEKLKYSYESPWTFPSRNGQGIESRMEELLAHIYFLKTTTANSIEVSKDIQEAWYEFLHKEEDLKEAREGI